MQGLIKNHWTFRGLIAVDEDGREGQAHFGMDIVIPDVGSDQGVYAGSPGRSDPSTGSIKSSSSPISNFKPPDYEGDPIALPLVDAGGDGSHSTYGSQAGGLKASHSSYDSQAGGSKAGGSKAGKPPNITTSSGLLFQQPTEGAPHPGVFSVKVRSRTEPSRSVIVVFQLQLRPGTTFGQLIDALSEMEPFHFRKIGVAYLGCRDFISQATAKWLKDGLLDSGVAQVALGGPDMTAASQAEGGNPADAMHIFKLLGWRYTTPLVPVDDADPSAGTMQGAIRRRNLIDRAIWPFRFVHEEDNMLKYNQVINNVAAA